MKLIKNLFKRVKSLFANIFGSLIDELYWALRHLFDKSWAEQYISKGSITHAHRKFLLGRISAYYPFKTCLEIGCASGPNIYLLAQKFPEVKVYGIDISKSAIKIGKRFFKEKAMDNIFLNVGNGLESLKKLHDKSIDIIFTDAVLIYFDKNKIESILHEMTRVVRRAVILLELYTEKPSYYDGHWIHNYKQLLAGFVPDKEIQLVKLPKGIWSGNWEESGYVIELSL